MRTYYYDEIDENLIVKDEVIIKGEKYIRYYYEEQFEGLPKFTYVLFADAIMNTPVDENENENLEKLYQRKSKLEKLRKCE